MHELKEFQQCSVRQLKRADNGGKEANFRIVAESRTSVFVVTKYDVLVLASSPW